MARARSDKEAAEARLADARERLEQAQLDAAEAGAGLAATVMQNIPEMDVEVLPGNSVSHGDRVFYGEGYPLAPDDHKGNDSLSLDGPTALALMQLGHVRIKGTVVN